MDAVARTRPKKTGSVLAMTSIREIGPHVTHQFSNKKESLSLLNQSKETNIKNTIELRTSSFFKGV